MHGMTLAPRTQPAGVSHGPTPSPLCVVELIDVDSSVLG